MGKRKKTMIRIFAIQCFDMRRKMRNLIRKLRCEPAYFEPWCINPLSGYSVHPVPINQKVLLGTPYSE